MYSFPTEFLLNEIESIKKIILFDFAYTIVFTGKHSFIISDVTEVDNLKTDILKMIKLFRTNKSIFTVYTSLYIDSQEIFKSKYEFK